MSEQIPIIDLFAGPGGLGEGFSRFPMDGSKKKFTIKVSIEKDPYAHKTLTLRAFFRQFPEGHAPNEYYEYLRGKLTRDELFAAYPTQSAAAKNEAQLRTLGEDPEVSKIIGDRIKGHKKWVLIGGPPCQAYSLVGRAAMSGKGTKRDGETMLEFEERVALKVKKFEGDHRHTLYLEYLRIIADHWPSVFVMENVKGILSSKYEGKYIFPKILEDLRQPSLLFPKGARKAYTYKIFSLVIPSAENDTTSLCGKDFLIRAEEYGIPQTRHRVILLGVRSDLKLGVPDVLKTHRGKSVLEAIGDLPKLTGGLSKAPCETAHEALHSIAQMPWWDKLVASDVYGAVFQRMAKMLPTCLRRENRGVRFNEFYRLREDPWYFDERLGGVCNHETRSHIREDLWRYFYSANYAKIYRRTPHLRDFPKELWPKHRNVAEAVNGTKFGDRFRVQVEGCIGTTVISHISKDGHYFIHYDPKQYRSFTVREAARIQTFPDNYFFEGPRTQQFHQVGNAVPPKLAYQIAKIVSDLFN